MTLLNRILSALVALVLLLGGLLAAAEILLALLGRQHWLVAREEWSAWLNEQTWEASTTRTVLVVLVLLGLLLMLIAARRGKPAVLTLPGQDDAVEVTASRRGVERTLADVARRVPGVIAASASAGRRAVRVTATAGQPSPQISGDVESAVRDRLQALGLAESLRPHVRVIGRSR